MSTLQSRVSRGIPAGGQFAATEHAEPALSLDVPQTDPAILANLTRPQAQVTLTEEEAENLRRPKTPILNTAARRGIREVTVDLTATNTLVRGIQDRLNRVADGSDIDAVPAAAALGSRARLEAVVSFPIR